jgi:hypothetical protein
MKFLTLVFFSDQPRRLAINASFCQMSCEEESIGQVEERLTVFATLSVEVEIKVADRLELSLVYQFFKSVLQKLLESLTWLD